MKMTIPFSIQGLQLAVLITSTSGAPLLKWTNQSTAKLDEKYSKETGWDITVQITDPNALGGGANFLP